MEATLSQQAGTQTSALGWPDAHPGAVTASPNDVEGPRYATIAGWLHGGAPKAATTPGRIVFPMIPEPGLLRVVVSTHFPETRPEVSATFDFRLTDIPLTGPDRRGKEEFLQYLQATLFREMCTHHRVPAIPAGCSCFTCRYSGPAPAGRFNPPIGSPGFFQELEARGVTCDYCMCWPVRPTRAPPPSASMHGHPPSPSSPADTEGCSSSDPERPERLDGPSPTRAVGADSSLAAWVGLGLRASPNFCVTWDLYCDMYGNSVTDPTRHSTEHIVGFADYLGQLATADMQAASGPLVTPGPQPGISVNTGLFLPGAAEPLTPGLYRRAIPQFITAVEVLRDRSP